MGLGCVTPECEIDGDYDSDLLGDYDIYGEIMIFMGVSLHDMWNWNRWDDDIYPHPSIYFVGIYTGNTELGVRMGKVFFRTHVKWSQDPNDEKWATCFLPENMGIAWHDLPNSNNRLYPWFPRLMALENWDSLGYTATVSTASHESWLQGFHAISLGRRVIS